MRWLDRVGECVGWFRRWSATKQDVAIITLVYFLSQGAILFLTGKWVDDWCPFWEEETLREMAYMTGSGEPCIWIKKLGYALPGNGYLFLVFVFFYVASVSLYSILQTIEDISRGDRFWLVLFFSVLPVNDARVTNICFPYSFCYGVFFFAWWFLSQYFSTGRSTMRLLFRVLALCLFTMSFVTNSFLVFYVIPLAYICYREKKRGIFCLWRYMDLLVAPIIFFVIKKILWQPYGFYAGYNKIEITGILGAVKYIPIVCFDIAWDVVRSIVPSSSFFLLVCGWGLYQVYSGIVWERTHESDEPHSIIRVLVGSGLLTIGVFPYLVVGRTSVPISGFQGRDALLTPLGLAFVMYYGIKLCSTQEMIRRFLYAAVVLFSINCTNQRYMEYQAWTYQQMAVGEHMRVSPEISKGQNFLWIHYGSSFRWDFWSMAGIAQGVFGDETRLFLTREEIHRSSWFKEKYGENMLTGHQYNLRDYDLKRQVLDGVILYQHPYFSLRALLGLKFDEMFHPARFKEKICKLGYMVFIPAGGAIVNDRNMKTMWSKEAAADISQRVPVPFERPERKINFSIFGFGAD